MSSVESLLAPFLLNKADGMQSESKVLSAFDNISNSLNRFVDALPQYRPVLKSAGTDSSSNVADGVIIDKSARVPTGKRLVVEDFNVNFTTVAGTIRIAILDGNDNEVTDIVRDITASVNGSGRTVLDQGERIAILGQVAGAGIFGVYFSGFLQKMETN